MGHHCFMSSRAGPHLASSVEDPWKGVLQSSSGVPSFPYTVSPQNPMQHRGLATIPEQCPQHSSFSGPHLAIPPSLLPLTTTTPTTRDILQLRPHIPFIPRASKCRTGLLCSWLEAEGMEGQTTIKQRRSLRRPCLSPSCQTEVVPKVCDEPCGQSLSAGQVGAVQLELELAAWR